MTEQENTQHMKRTHSPSRAPYRGPFQKPIDAAPLYLLSDKQGVILQLPGDKYLGSNTNSATQRHS